MNNTQRKRKNVRIVLKKTKKLRRITEPYFLFKTVRRDPALLKGINKIHE